MSAPTDFEKRLAELNLTYAQIELVKQAVEEFYIKTPPKEHWYVGIRRKPTIHDVQRYCCACGYWANSMKTIESHIEWNIELMARVGAQ